LTTSKQRRLRAAAITVTASFLFSAGLFWVFPTVFGSWDNQTIDRLFVLREQLHPSPYDTSIIHIDIDNSSIKKLSYYFPRRYHADLLDVAGKIGFSAIAYDIIFAQRQQTGDDSILLAASAVNGHVYYPVAFALERGEAKPKANDDERKFLDSTAWNIPAMNIGRFYSAGMTLLTWPELSNTAKGVGYISVETDPDGVFRRVPLLIRYGDKLYPSMVFRLACNLLKVPPENISVEGGRAIIIKDAHLRNGKIGNLEIPVDAQGNIRINWIGPWERMTHISFVRLLEAAGDRDEIDAFSEQLSGSIGLVGDVSTGISDIGPTPFEEQFPLVGLHANTLNTILTSNFLREFPASGILGIAIVLAALMIFFSYRFSSVLFIVSSLTLLILYGFFVSLAFIYGNVILTIIQPTIAIIFSSVSVIAYRYMTEEKEKEQLRKRFESYFPPTVVKQMLENPDAGMTKPRTAEVTIMFSDIKSFTTHSSHMTPEEISTTLSEYFEAMTDIVFRYGGTVDKFIGDGLMVFYGAPETQPDHAVRCVNAAIEMQKKCRELKNIWEPVGRLPLKIRIGINTGRVIVGDLGSERRKEFTVLGSDVNLAQRLESNAPVEGIMISESTFTHIEGKIPTRPLEPIKVKGLDIPIIVYEVPVVEENSSS
jgi:adenylate cyclase